MTRRLPPLLVVILVALFAATGATGRAHQFRAGWDAGSLSTPSFPAQVQDFHGLIRAVATRPTSDGPGRESGASVYLDAGPSHESFASIGSATIRRDAGVLPAAANRSSHYATGPPVHR